MEHDTDSKVLAQRIVDRFFSEQKKERRFRYIRMVYMLILVFGFGFLYLAIAKSFSRSFDISRFSSGSIFSIATDFNEELYRTFPGTSETTDSISHDSAFVEGIEFPTAGIAIFPVDRIILGSVADGERSWSFSTVLQLRKFLELVGEQALVKTVILYINSPGGSVAASDEIYRLIREWKEKSGVRVVAYFGDVAASGGYYIAQATDHVVSGTTTITGSIGVIAWFLNYAEFLDKVGIKNEVIKSGIHKDIGSGFRAMTEKEREILRQLIDESYERFLSIVVEGRKGKLSDAEIRKLADGRIFSGSQAYKYGLVDGVGSFDSLLESEVERLRAEEGLYGKVSVVIYRPKFNLFPELFANAQALQKFFSGDAHQPLLWYLWKEF